MDEKRLPGRPSIGGRKEQFIATREQSEYIARLARHFGVTTPDAIRAVIQKAMTDDQKGSTA